MAGNPSTHDVWPDGSVFDWSDARGAWVQTAGPGGAPIQTGGTWNGSGVTAPEQGIVDRNSAKALGHWPNGARYRAGDYDADTNTAINVGEISDPSKNRGGAGAAYHPPDHFFDISPADQLAIDKNIQTNKDTQRAYDYKLGRDAIDDTRYGGESTYKHGQDAFNNDLAVATAKRQQQTADQNYQVGMSGAQTAQDRENVTAAYNRELANIAAMNNETTTRNNEQQNNTTQFGAETNRAKDMGDLALRNNQFILDASGKPHNMWGLFNMERGVAPDWATMRAGGTPAQGSALAPADVMRAYVPTTAAPTFDQNWAPSARANVGTYSAAAVPKANPYLASDYKAPAGPTYPSAPAPPAAVTPRAVVPAVSTGDAYHSGGNVWTADGTPGGRWTDPGGYYQSNGGSWTNADGSAYTRMADGGFTNDSLLMAGDSALPDPSADGAKPETIWNPTRAPLAIKPNPDNIQSLGTGLPLNPAGAPVSAPGRMADGQGSTFTASGPEGQAQIQAPVQTRPVGGAYDYMKRLDMNAGRTPGMGDNHYRSMKMFDYGGRGFRPTPGMFRQPVSAPGIARYAGGTGQYPGPSFPANSSPPPPPTFDPKWAQTSMGANPGIPSDPNMIGADGTMGVQPGPGEPGGPNMPLGGPSLGDAGWPPEVPGEVGNGVGNDMHTGTVDTSSIISRMLDLMLRNQGDQGADPTTPPPPPDPFGAAKKVMPRFWSGTLPATTPAYDTGHILPPGPPPRYAFGTDNSAAYANAGMGGAYIPSSSNSYLGGQDLPPALRMMIDAGMPIPPGVAAALRGGSVGGLNMGAANTAAGAGVLPSLQGLRGLSQNERQSWEGFLDGPGGSDSKEAEDFVGRPTENLQQAAVARSGY